MAVAHEGGIFVTRTLSLDDPAPLRYASSTRASCRRSVSSAARRTPSSSAARRDWHFLETSARVGGAYIVDVVEAATGVNLWREWAKVEIAGEDGSYEPPPIRDLHAGIVLSLARQPNS